MVRTISTASFDSREILPEKLQLILVWNFFQSKDFPHDKTLHGCTHENYARNDRWGMDEFFFHVKNAFTI
jgi:hypothetical protein